MGWTAWAARSSARVDRPGSSSVHTAPRTGGVPLAPVLAAEERVEAALDWLFRHTDPAHPLIAELRRLARTRMLVAMDSRDGD